MTDRGRVVVRGRGRASTRGLIGRGSPDNNHGRGGTPPPLRGGERGGGRGSHFQHGVPSRGRGRGSLVFMHGQTADVDPRIADDSDKVLVASFRSLGVKDAGGLPLRPDFGTDGREIKLRTNFFPVEVAPGTKLYAYDVSFPSFVPRRLKKRIYELAARTTEWVQAGMALPGRVAHDENTRLVSAYPLSQPLVIRVPYYDEDQGGPLRQGGTTYTLTIRLIQEIATTHLLGYLAGQNQYRHYDASFAISALNVVLTFFPRKMGLVISRREYISGSRLTAEPFRLGEGVEAWKGVCMSTRPVYKQLMLNADLFTMLFYTTGNLAYTMMALNGASLGAHWEISRLLRGVRVEATYLGYRKAIKKVVPLTAKTWSFDAPEYGHITMEEYLKRKYNIQLQYPDLQLVDVGVQASIYLPAELCNILPCQPFRRELTGQNAAMSSVASLPPPANGEKTVVQFRRQFGLNVIRPELETFGITIGPNMAVVPARILPSPEIRYASSDADIGEHAFWNLVGVKFAVGARLDNWTVLVIKDGVPRAEFAGPSDRELHEVVSAFRHMCNACGMHVTADPTYATTQLPRDGSEPFDLMRREAIQAIKTTLLSIKPKPTLVLIMLANSDEAIYEGVKHLCDVRLDVATVCVQSAKIRRRNPHYLANVVSKINMKLGGVNHKLDGKNVAWLRDVPTMVIGMDVTHPSPGSSLGSPSIAAVVASVDNDFAQYPAILDIQASRVELIINVKRIMIDQLKLFQKKNEGKLPERILIYRCGVPESHFRVLSEMEIPSILEAFYTFTAETPYRPKLTIVSCNKSRHVRFYPTEQNNATVNGNPLPGTVVDRGITAIYNFDFFLQSHGDVVSGTARPTHYYVVYDEIGFDADNIQGVTNALSYMFGRATQAVSMVCPAYYANAACRRGRCYLRKLYRGYVDGGTTASGTQTGWETTTEQDAVLQEAQRLWGWGVAGAGLKDSMFYL